MFFLCLMEIDILCLTEVIGNIDNAISKLLKMQGAFTVLLFIDISSIIK